MRKIIGVVVSCLVACSLFLTVQSAFGASATLGTAWIPRDLNVLTVEDNTEGLTDPYSFGLYEIADTSNVLVLHNSEGLHLDRLEFNYNNDTQSWDIKVYKTTVVNNVNVYTETATMNFGGSKEFGFFFSNDTNGLETSPINYTNYDYDYYDIGGQDDQYQLSWFSNQNIEHAVFTTDAIPVSGGTSVPIPTAMVLLSSGLVGLAGFKRKMDN